MSLGISQKACQQPHEGTWKQIFSQMEPRDDCLPNLHGGYNLVRDPELEAPSCVMSRFLTQKP